MKREVVLRGRYSWAYSAGFSQHVALSFTRRSVGGASASPPDSHYLAASRHEATYSPNPQLRHQFLGRDLYRWLFVPSASIIFAVIGRK